MTSKENYKGVPARDRSAVAVYLGVRNARGANLTPIEAWKELASAQAKRAAEKKPLSVAAAINAPRINAADELDKHARALAGVSDILRMVGAEYDETDKALSLVAEIVARASAAIFETAGRLMSGALK